MHHLVNNWGNCEDASDDGNQLDEEAMPTLIFSHFKRRHRIRLVSEHDHGDTRQQQFIYTDSVEETLANKT